MPVLAGHVGAAFCLEEDDCLSFSTGGVSFIGTTVLWITELATS
jgi:hypothetical protein